MTLPKFFETTLAKDECSVCLIDAESESMYLCIECGEVFCLEHALAHNEITAHSVYCTCTVEFTEPSGEQTELSIGTDKGFKTGTREFSYGLIRLPTFEEIEGAEGQAIINTVESCNSFINGQKVDEWKMQKKQCGHLSPLDGMAAAETNNVECCSHPGCDQTTNLWVCLDCGHIGCGRRQGDGSGGNEHAIEHSRTTGHQVVLNAGTLHLAEPDVFCYECDDMCVIPDLPERLEHFGVHSQLKEKSLIERDIKLNQDYSFSAEMEGTQDGIAPAFGPALYGIRNIGNTCFAAVVFQLMLNVGPVVEQICATPTHLMGASYSLAQQMRRVFQGLTSELPSTYRRLPHNTEECIQKGVLLQNLFNVMAVRYPMYAAYEQQDAFEYLMNLLNVLEEDCSVDLSSLEMLCTDGDKVRKQRSILTTYAITEPGSYDLLSLVRTKCDPFTVACPPEFLFVCINRYYYDVEQMKPVKCDVSVNAPPILDFSSFIDQNPAQEYQWAKAAAPSIHPNDEQLMMFAAMGIDADVAINAFIKCNGDMNNAVNYAFDHPSEKYSSGEAGSDLELNNTIRRNIQRTPMYELTGLITHKGGCSTVGHYIAHAIRSVNGESKWALFNDSKVGVISEPPTQQAYVYMYKLRS
ncbi:hypothetical protein PCE1_004373 [Barthelona sp. PCE]